MNETIPEFTGNSLSRICMKRIFFMCSLYCIIDDHYVGVLDITCVFINIKSVLKAK